MALASLDAFTFSWSHLSSSSSGTKAVVEVGTSTGAAESPNFGVLLPQEAMGGGGALCLEAQVPWTRV